MIPYVCDNCHKVWHLISEKFIKKWKKIKKCPSCVNIKADLPILQVEQDRTLLWSLQEDLADCYDIINNLRNRNKWLEEHIHELENEKSKDS